PWHAAADHRPERYGDVDDLRSPPTYQDAHRWRGANALRLLPERTLAESHPAGRQLPDIYLRCGTPSYLNRRRQWRSPRLYARRRRQSYTTAVVRPVGYAGAHPARRLQQPGPALAGAH